MLATLRTRLERMREEMRQQEQALADQRAMLAASEDDLRARLEEAERLRSEAANDKQLWQSERERFDARKEALEQAVAHLRKTQESFAAEQAELEARQAELDAVTAEQSARTLERKEELATLGLGVEDFGGGTVLVTSYPAVLGRTPPGDILKAIVDHLNAHDRLPPREVLLQELMSLMACHAAVRSGDALSQEEVAALVKMRHLAHADHCPHGRPTALLFTRHDLDKQFKRI